MKTKCRAVVVAIALFQVLIIAPPAEAQWGWWWQRDEPEPVYTPRPRRTQPKKRKAPTAQETEKTFASKDTATSEPMTFKVRPDGVTDLDIPADTKERDVSGVSPRNNRKQALLPEPKEWDPPPDPAPLPIRDGYTRIIWSDTDSLRHVAEMCSTTVQRILSENNLKQSEMREGQVLRVPAPADRPGLFSPEEQLQREVWRGIRGRKQIALTFDAGGEMEGVYDLLEALKAEKAAASFFVTGDFVRKHSHIVKLMADAGHPIYNHSWSHPEFTAIDSGQMARELGKTDAIVKAVAGKRTIPFWRPPFGDRDPRILRETARLGYQSIYWTLDSLDSVGERKSSEFILNRIKNPPRAYYGAEHFLDGAIILMHVGEMTTAEAVPNVIRYLREKGFTLVTVEEILTP